jgi:hypothetical protein
MSSNSFTGEFAFPASTRACYQHSQKPPPPLVDSALHGVTFGRSPTIMLTVVIA